MCKAAPGFRKGQGQEPRSAFQAHDCHGPQSWLCKVERECSAQCLTGREASLLAGSCAMFDRKGGNGWWEPTVAEGSPPPGMRRTQELSIGDTTAILFVFPAVLLDTLLACNPPLPAPDLSPAYLPWPQAHSGGSSEVSK